VNTTAALLQGRSLTGQWIDRPRQYAARNRGEDASDERFAVEEMVILSPLPCWAHLSPERYRQRIEALVEEVEEEAARVRRQTGSRVLGVKAILAQDPQARPDRLARSPAPLVHAATKAACRMFYELYAEFVSAFRNASEALRRGNRDAPLPRGQLPARPAVRRWTMQAELFDSRTPAGGPSRSSRRPLLGEVCPENRLGGGFERS
jgi:hypothetical protein